MVRGGAATPVSCRDVSPSPDIRVELDAFNGPLDLLLYLIRRDEVDIFDIPVAKITDRYLEHVRQLRDLDLDAAGEFLVMAATLIELKSAMLLPQEPVPASSLLGPTTDPRAALVQQLLDYKRFRDAAALLEIQQSSHARRFVRVPVLPDAGDEPPPLDLDEVQIWDLLEAFGSLMAQVSVRPRYHEVVDDDTPIDLHAADVEDRVRRDKRVRMVDLFAGRSSRGEMIGVFLAILELIREKRVLAVVDEQQQVSLIDAPPEHRRTFAGASLQLSNANLEDERAD
jgi:segregation and condensation protein A